MDTRIPIPTDNIYKFYALFGLVLTIASISLTIYVNKATNDFLFSAWVEEAELNAITNPNPVQAAKKEALTNNLEVTLKNKEFYLKVLAVIAGVGALLMGLGFYKWRFLIQPKQDELLELQIEKARRELLQMGQIKCSRKRGN